MRLRGVMDYLMVVVGVLAALAALVLLVAFGLLSFEESPGLLSLFMAFPLLVDIFVLSPGIPLLYLVLLIVPLLLTLALALRILINFGGEGGTGARAHPGTKYGLGQLIIFGIGATLGPSVFVVLPEAVKRYGFSSIWGVVLASTSALLLALLYARMDRLTHDMGGSAVGGPAFVRRAYGPKHPSYLASRFSMWVANTSLAAFNMLVLMDVVASYMVPDALALIGREDMAPGLNTPLRILIFVLTLVALKYANDEASLVKLQYVVGPFFVLLFVVHIGTLLASPASGSPSPGPLLSLDALPAMAFVYMVVFGFQEIQSLAEGIPGTGDERERLLRNALAISVVLPAALFIVYSLAIYLLGEVPETPIPAVDLTTGWARALTEGALLLGIATTFIPALVTASNHLREMLIDIFDVRREVAESQVGRYLVAFFVLILLSADATYLVELTDFGVLISMIAIAWSVTRLEKMAGMEEKVVLPLISVLLTGVAAFVLAVVSPDVAFGGVLFILAATISLGVVAYELEVVELLTLVTSLIALISSPAVIEAMKGLSAMGALPPTIVAFLPFAQIALDILAISTFMLTAYLLVKNRRTVLIIMKPAFEFFDLLKERFKAWRDSSG
ncbi:MAG: hypothetical protein QI197_08245 [Candidatus Korarchaeota archaeon]|nr:hypothetical protein [Candidatus Korarchaeota archaeon]